MSTTWTVDGHGNELSNINILKDLGHGAYTAARTIDNNQKVLQLTEHLRRLQESCYGMLDHEVNEGTLSPELTTTLKETLSYTKLYSTTGKMMHQYINTSSHWHTHKFDPALQIIIFVKWTPTGDVSYYLSVRPAPSHPASLHIGLVPFARSNPTVKSTEWVVDRAALEIFKTEHQLDEVVIFNESSQILEGLTSNFFAVLDEHILQTCTVEGVLSGTIRKITIEASQSMEKVQVIESFPLTKDVTNKWTGGLVTSSSRLAIPVHKVSLYKSDRDAQPIVEKEFDIENSLALNIANNVKSLAMQHGVELSSWAIRND